MRGTRLPPRWVAVLLTWAVLAMVMLVPVNGEQRTQPAASALQQQPGVGMRTVRHHSLRKLLQDEVVEAQVRIRSSPRRTSLVCPHLPRHLRSRVVHAVEATRWRARDAAGWFGSRPAPRVDAVGRSIHPSGAQARIGSRPRSL